MKSYLIKFFLYLTVGLIILKLPAVQPAVENFCLFLAYLIENLLTFFDGGIQRNGSIIFRNTYGYAIDIRKACSALNYVVTLSAAVLAFPIAWTQRIKWILMFILIAQAINLLRIVTLIYFKVGFSAETFIIFHEQFWPLLLTLLYAGCFYLWCLSQLTRHKANTDIVDKLGNES